MANFEARKVLMKDAQGRYVIPFTGAVETVNGQKPDENGNVVIEGVDTTTLLTKTAAAETYLSKTDASATYLRVDTAADTFLSKADASSTYLTPAQASSAYLGIGDKAVSAETADNAVSATMASKAISDINGNAIATTYATNQKLFQNDGAGPLLRSDIMPIKTVNGQEPDEAGNIQVGTGDAYEADILEAADKALETVTNVGNTDIADVLSAVASVEARVDSHIRVVETWSSGTEWYRIWSDGFIEQGGKTPAVSAENLENKINLYVPMSSTNYYCNANAYEQDNVSISPYSTTQARYGLVTATIRWRPNVPITWEVRGY